MLIYVIDTLILNDSYLVQKSSVNLQIRAFAQLAKGPHRYS